MRTRLSYHPHKTRPYASGKISGGHDRWLGSWVGMLTAVLVLLSAADAQASAGGVNVNWGHGHGVLLKTDGTV